MRKLLYSVHREGAFIGINEPDQLLIGFLHAKGIPVIPGVLGNLDKKAEAQGNKVYKNYIDLGVGIQRY